MVRAFPLSRFFTVTLAVGITAPVGSCTTPLSDAAPTWARAAGTSGLRHTLATKIKPRIADWLRLIAFMYCLQRKTSERLARFIQRMGMALVSSRLVIGM